MSSRINHMKLISEYQKSVVETLQKYAIKTLTWFIYNRLTKMYRYLQRE